MRSKIIDTLEESFLALNQTIYVERYNDNGLIIAGDSFTWDDDYVRIYKKEKLVAVFREEDINYVILS